MWLRWTTDHGEDQGKLQFFLYRSEYRNTGERVLDKVVEIDCGQVRTIRCSVELEAPCARAYTVPGQRTQECSPEQRIFVIFWDGFLSQTSFGCQEESWIDAFATKDQLAYQYGYVLIACNERGEFSPPSTVTMVRPKKDGRHTPRSPKRDSRRVH